jgi:hypothetical protein
LFMVGYIGVKANNRVIIGEVSFDLCEQGLNTTQVSPPKTKHNTYFVW